MEKRELRSMIRAKKRAMTASQIENASHDLAMQLFQSDCYKNAKSVYAYLSYNQEVRTNEIILRAIADGKTVAVPKVYGDTMRFLVIENLEGLEKGYSGIPEPIFDEPVAEDPTALVLMPGLAFDKEGHRIGYGGGFYDRFLAEEPNHPTVALCYDFQMQPHVETEEFDVPVDLVLWAEIGE